MDTPSPTPVVSDETLESILDYWTQREVFAPLVSILTELLSRRKSEAADTQKDKLRIFVLNQAIKDVYDEAYQHSDGAEDATDHDKFCAWIVGRLHSYVSAMSQPQPKEGGE